MAAHLDLTKQRRNDTHSVEEQTASCAILPRGFVRRAKFAVGSGAWVRARGGFTNENYLSMVALIRFGSFDYLWASDLGDGHMDEARTRRSTNQVNLETPLPKTLTPGGTTPACTREASRAARFAILSSLSSTLLAAKTLRSQTPFRRGRVSMRRI